VSALGARTFIHSGRRGRAATGSERCIVHECRAGGYRDGVALALAVKLALLYGTVTIGPVTPVCRAGVPCDRPAAGVTLTFTRRGQAVTARTSAAGAYRVRLAPGIYTVRASAGMSIRPQAIEVRGPSTRLALAIDTGIR
jgi:hypothetical protein